MPSYTDAQLDAARARRNSISDRIGKILRDRDPFYFGTLAIQASTNPAFEAYVWNGGAEPTAAALIHALDAATAQKTAPDSAFARYSARVADLEKKFGREVTSVEMLTIAREVGYVSQHSPVPVRRDGPMTSEEINAYGPRYEAATGEPWAPLDADRRIEYARFYREHDLRQVPQTPVSDDIAARGLGDDQLSEVELVARWRELNPVADRGA